MYVLSYDKAEIQNCVDSEDPLLLSENELNDALNVLWRLYLAFLILDLFNGMSITTATEKYKIDKFHIQLIQMTAPNFAGNNLAHI